MSTVRTVWIRCDECGESSENDVGINHDAREALATALKAGWSSVPGVPRKDYCRFCTARRKGLPLPVR